MPRQLSRRRLVTALGGSVATSLAGCVDSVVPSTNSNNESESSNPTHTTSVTATDSTVVEPGGSGPVQRIEVAEPPEQSPFRHKLDFLTQPTGDHPARLQVSLTNADDTEHTIRTNNSGLPFPSRVGKAVEGDATLVLSPDGDAERRDGCWRAYPKTLPTVETKTLSPGETLSATYALVNHMDTDTCWPTGSYRFSQQYEVDPEAGRVEYDWWFAVSV